MKHFIWPSGAGVKHAAGQVGGSMVSWNWTLAWHIWIGARAAHNLPPLQHYYESGHTARSVD